MGIPFLSEIERLINEHGSATVLRERLALANDQFVLLERKVAQLQQENAQARQRCDELERQLARYLQAEQFEECRGALFKKRPGGGYALAVYCPTCRKSTSAFPEGEQYVCGPCNWFSAFREVQIAAVMAELP